MNAAGQALIEFILLMAVVMIVLVSFTSKLPKTFKSSTPFLAGKVETRLQTGAGFGYGQVWQKPVKGTRGGVKEE